MLARALDGGLAEADFAAIRTDLRSNDWTHAEAAAEVAEAAAAHAARAPMPDVERAERLALVSTLVPALVDALKNYTDFRTECDACVGCVEASLTAIACISAACVEAHEHRAYDALHSLPPLLPQLASPPSLLRPLAALLKILAVHPKLGPALCEMPALLRRCRRDEHASADARIASALLALHAPPAAPPPLRAEFDVEKIFFASIGLDNFRRLHWQRTPLHLPAATGGEGRRALCSVLLPIVLAAAFEPRHLPPPPPPPDAATLSVLATAHRRWLLDALRPSAASLGGPPRHGDDVLLVRAVDGRPALGAAEGAKLGDGAIAKAFSAGYTVALRSAHWRCGEAVAALLAPLQRALGASATANLYVTPPGARGLPAHYDDHCVLALQIMGRKAWRLSGPRPAELLPPLGAARDRPIPRGNASREIVLGAGDVLYVPRGVVHECEALDDDDGGEPSVHLTLALEVEAELTMGAMLRDMFGGAVGEALEAAERGERGAPLRAAAPAAGVGAAAAKAECRALLRSAGEHRLARELSDESVAAAREELERRREALWAAREAVRAVYAAI